MRNTFLILCLQLTIIAFSQDTSKQIQDQYFIINYTLGENWNTTKEAHEQLYFSEHSAHLSELRKSKVIAIGGRYSDKGMIIMKALNQSEAQKIIAKDPAIQHKVFKAEIYLFMPFYKGCIE